MRIFSHTLESLAADQIETEVRFVIASARATSNSLIHLTAEGEIDGKIYTDLQKLLKLIKKQGKIDFFASKEDFSDHSAKASYLMNKFPEVSDVIHSDHFFIIIKI